FAARGIMICVVDAVGAVPGASVRVPRGLSGLGRVVVPLVVLGAVPVLRKAAAGQDGADAPPQGVPERLPVVGMVASVSTLGIVPVVASVSALGNVAVVVLVAEGLPEQVADVRVAFSPGDDGRPVVGILVPGEMRVEVFQGTQTGWKASIFET